MRESLTQEGEKTEPGRTRSNVNLKKILNTSDLIELKWMNVDILKGLNIYVRTCSFTVITCACVIQVSGAVLYNFLRFSAVVATKYLLNSYKQQLGVVVWSNSWPHPVSEILAVPTEHTDESAGASALPFILCITHFVRTEHRRACQWKISVDRRQKKITLQLICGRRRRHYFFNGD